LFLSWLVIFNHLFFLGMTSLDGIVHLIHLNVTKSSLRFKHLNSITIMVSRFWWSISHLQALTSALPALTFLLILHFNPNPSDKMKHQRAFSKTVFCFCSVLTLFWLEVCRKSQSFVFVTFKDKLYFTAAMLRRMHESHPSPLMNGCMDVDGYQRPKNAIWTYLIS